MALDHPPEVACLRAISAGAKVCSGTAVRANDPVPFTERVSAFPSEGKAPDRLLANRS